MASNASATVSFGNTSSRLSGCSRNSIEMTSRISTDSDERADDQPIDRGLEPPARDQRQDQRGEGDRPESSSTSPVVSATRRVDLTEQRPDEEAEARRRHQRAAAAVRPPPPRDEPERGERAADQAVHHVEADDGRIAGEHDRHQRAELGRDRQRPQRDPEAGAAARSCEAVRDPHHGLSAWTRRKTARHGCSGRPAADHSILLAGSATNPAAA